MRILEIIWDFMGLFFGGTLERAGQLATTVFGSANARQVAKLRETADKITALEPRYEALSDEELRGQTEVFRKRLRQGESLEELLIEAFAVCREGGKRFLGMRHYDV